MKQTKLTGAFLAFLALAALLTGLYFFTRPDPVSGTKSIAVQVVHADERLQIFTFKTEKKYLGDLLLSEGLIKGDSGPYGLYITEADGEVADYSENKSYWALFEGDNYASQGADTTPLTDGAVFRLVYTVG